jgi:hypothetical protein
MVTQDLDGIRSAPTSHGHSEKWVAPENLNDRGKCTKEADVFSFAGIAVEVRYQSPTEVDHRRTIMPLNEGFYWCRTFQ